MASTTAHGSHAQEAGFFAERADFMRRLDELLTTTDPDAADAAVKWMVDVVRWRRRETRRRREWRLVSVGVIQVSDREMRSCR
jgi:hypothetical protein